MQPSGITKPADTDTHDQPINTDRRTTKSQFLTRQCCRQTQTQETGGCMYGEGLLMMSA
jgi:hypothetical protein